jgi:hypothetical protein
MLNKKRAAYIVLFFCLIIFTPVFAGAAGLIPCATSDHPEPCTLCHFIVGFKSLVDFGMSLITIAAIVGIFFAGVMYVISSGDQAMMEKAKGFLKASLIGFAVVFLGWLVVTIVMWAMSARDGLGIKPGLVWYKFTCSTVSTQGQGSAAATTPSVSAPE